MNSSMDMLSRRSWIVAFAGVPFDFLDINILP
jgi:hypothetical protein